MRSLCLISFHSYISCVIIKIVFVGVYYCQNISYSELQSLNASCFPLDTCSQIRTPSEDNLLSKNCECRDSCVKYNTCCIDSPHHPFKHETSRSLQIDKQQECYYLDKDLSIYAETKCADEWQGHMLVKDLCENATQSLKDPLMILPVTNYVTATTYKNYFCALCNNDIRNLEFWNVNIQRIKSRWGYSETVDVDDSEESILQNLAYNDQSGVWGLHKKTADSLTAEENSTETAEPEEPFEYLKITFRPSGNLWLNVTPCNQYLISDCDEEWTDDAVRNKCHSYMGMIYYPRTNVGNGDWRRKYARYRNQYCAICNNAVGSPQCVVEAQSGWGYGAKRPTLSFTLLLDVNTLDGTKVGSVEQCGANELYDPFFKKCRSMICAKPGYKIRDGKCQVS